MAEPSSKILEARLMMELTGINHKIRELETEKRSLERLLTRIRHEEVENQEVGRKNSAKRILVEKAVLDRLSVANGKSVTSYDLWRAANDVELRLNQSTFRSYLHRMKAKGLVEPALLHGRWRLPETPIGAENNS